MYDTTGQGKAMTQAAISSIRVLYSLFSHTTVTFNHSPWMEIFAPGM